jgi:O-acetyl-ADP-ribose deacetylase (regulator of RNase III)
MSEVIIARTCRHGLLKVIAGDITKYEADIIVTGANNRLAGREGLDEDIHQAAGEELRLACREIAQEKRVLNQQPCPVGNAVATKPYALPCKHLVHVVGPDCRRPSQDEGRRELLRKAYESMFEVIAGLKPRKTVVSPPISMGIFAYPHREGARMTMQILLNWLDADEDPGVSEYIMLVSQENYVNNLKTVYRETEDQFPGHDSTREYRRKRF